MNIISGVYWDRGKRENNQDSLMLEQVYTRKGRVLLAVVSDGIGGLCEGETASGLIQEQLLQKFYQEILMLIRRGKGKRALERSFLRCFYELNQMLNQYGKSKGIQLGATVTLLLIYKKRYLLMHLGDSRSYMIPDRSFLHKLMGKKIGIRRLTRDHVDDLGRLTGCIGSFAYQQPDIKKGRITGKTGFLLCTDGFYHFLKEEMLQEVLNPREMQTEEQIEKRLKQLALFGLKQGEKDNVSAIYAICG